MSQSISIRGSITAGSGLCQSDGGVGQLVRQLGLGGCCGDGVSYSSVVVTAVQVATPGDVGQNFAQLDALADLAEIELLYVQTSARVRFRIDARASTTLGVGGIYPTNFAGGETVDWTMDGMSPVTVTFTSGDQSVEQVAARFNAAAALVGAPTPRVTVQLGQLLFTSAKASPVAAESRNVLTGSTPTLTRLGLLAPTVTPGKGGDVEIVGMGLWQFPRSPIAPVRVDVSGNAKIEIIAAGRPA